MKIARPVFFALLHLLVPFTVACMSVPVEGERIGGGEGRPWAALEQELRDSGMSVDTSSLIALANSDREAHLRWNAIEILGLRKEALAREVLWQLTSGEEDRLLQETAALALARLGDERGTTALREFAHTTPTTQRQLFLAARLAEMGDAGAYPQVVDATSSADAYERFLSVAALVPFARLSVSGKAIDPDPLQELLRLAQDGDAKVRYEVLVQLPIASAQAAAVQRAMPTVRKMAQEDPDPGVREKARLVLLLWAPASN